MRKFIGSPVVLNRLLLGVMLSLFIMGISARQTSAQAPPPCTAPAIIYSFDRATSNLVSFTSAAPGTIITNIPVTGLNPNEFIVGLDFRPSNGLLYGIASDDVTDRLVTINDLADIVAKVAGICITKKHVPGPQGVRGRNCDNSKLRTELCWTERVSLEEGFARTYAWIESELRRA